MDILLDCKLVQRLTLTEQSKEIQLPHKINVP